MPDAEKEVNVVVMGGASTIWEDLEKIPTGWADIVIAVNDIGSHYDGTLHHWCSLHPDKFPAWEATRKALGYAGGYKKWGMSRPAGVDPGPVDAVVDHWGGSSAGLAVNVALTELGATSVVLCGCPQDQRPHYHRMNTPWQHWDVYRKDWERLKKSGKLDRVRSMSGWTRELLEAPEWLK